MTTTRTLDERIAIALVVAETEASPLDTSSIQNEVMRLAFGKMGEQWVFVRDVLRDVLEERKEKKS